MFTSLLIAVVLVAVTVSVHTAGFALILQAVTRAHAAAPIQGWLAIVWVLIRVTWWFLLIHGAEITVWAMCYRWVGCLPDAESAFYFSGATYTTIGYGDLVLVKPCRMLGPVEGLTGILMCGLSAGLFFAIVQGIYMRSVEAKRK